MYHHTLDNEYIVSPDETNLSVQLYDNTKLYCCPTPMNKIHPFFFFFARERCIHNPSYART